MKQRSVKLPECEVRKVILPRASLFLLVVISTDDAVCREMQFTRSRWKISPLKLACMLIHWCRKLLQLFTPDRKLGESNGIIALFSFGPS